MVNASGGDPEALLSENTADAWTVDLTDHPVPETVEAMASLERLVDEAIAAARSQGLARVWLKFPLATPGAGQTLFAPVGKALRARLSSGALVRVMPAKDGGWIARIQPD